MVVEVLEVVEGLGWDEFELLVGVRFLSGPQAISADISASPYPLSLPTTASDMHALSALYMPSDNAPNSAQKRSQTPEKLLSLRALCLECGDGRVRTSV